MFFSKKRFPSAEAFESELALKEKLYQKFVATSNSKDLKEYFELEKEINTEAFKQEKQRLQKLRYKGSDAAIKERQYKKLCKNRKIKLYFDVVGSETLKAFEAFRKSEDYKTIEDSKARKGNAELAKYYKYEKSKPYRVYSELNGSSLVSDYNNLQTYIESKEFIAFKALCEDKNRYEKTEMFKKETRFAQLVSDEGIQVYLKYAETDYFYDLKHYSVAFSENFASRKLDQEKWDTSFLWSAGQGKDLYSTMDEFQAYKSDTNLKVDGSQLVINTKKENVSGKFWHPQNGFCLKEVPFSSALLSTGNHFNVSKGKVEVKLKVSGNHQVSHNLWLANPLNNQMIILGQSGKKSITIGTAFKQNNVFKKAIQEVDKVVLSKEWYVLGVAWSEDKITWQVNGKEVHSMRFNLKKDKFHLILNSTVNDKDKAGDASLYVDWIKAYKMKSKDKK